MPDVVEGVVAVLSGPSVQLLRPALQPELLMGDGFLPRLIPSVGIAPYGGIFTLQTVPAGLGHEAGPFPRYELPLLTLTTFGRLANTVQVELRKTDVFVAEQLVRWDPREIGSIAFHVLPFTSFAFSYLYL